VCPVGVLPLGRVLEHRWGICASQYPADVKDPADAIIEDMRNPSMFPLWIAA
jgi:hypothetical protein